MKKLRLIILLSFVMATSTMLVACSNGKTPDGGAFAYNRVLVFLTEAASAQNREWTPSDFPEFAFSEIVDNGPVGPRTFLTFYLSEPSRENVLRAIYQLEKRVEIHHVGPDRLETGGV